MLAFVGRTEPLARLTAAYQALAAPGGTVSGWAGLVLVIGEAGIGKTTLLTRFASRVRADGGTVVWGTCWDGDQAPAWWPWTQALRGLLDRNPEVADAAQPELAAIVPELNTNSSVTEVDAAARVRVFDAAGQTLARAAGRTPVVVILDDLHSADQSSVELMRFVAHQPQQGALMLVGAYRPYEAPPGVAGSLADLASVAELVPLQGLSAEEVADLVRVIAGEAAQDHWPQLVYERSGGHPFYARELCQLLATAGNLTDVPAAVREVIGRRLARLSAECGTVLDVAAVAGSVLLPDVLAEVTGKDTNEIDALAAEAIAAGIFAAASRQDGAVRFAHDLYRETIYAALPLGRRLDLHHRVANALLRRHERGSQVFSAELAYHFAAAIPEVGAAPAVAWAYAAASADSARFAFLEAAGHLARVRSTIADTGQRLSDSDLVGLMTNEADLRLHAGDSVHARELLDAAWTQAAASGEADLLGAVALGFDSIGARFAMPRADLVSVLDTARRALSDTGTTTEAKVTAALARQLQHSVQADRPRARPLADEAVRIARTLDDPATLASCMLAQHDTLWTPGTGTARAAIAAEIAALAKQANDQERLAQALLLLATARLEDASPAFRATLAEYAYLTERLRQPRQDYLLRTRQAALALLDGDIETGERLSAEAAILGEQVGEGDTGNVRMSQRLEIVRARNQPAELRAMAAEAVRWWIGAPAHGHAIAAGFSARAGDLDAARRELDIVLALEDWHTDRSYLWSIFIGEMATAAIALHDNLLCQRLLEDLLPFADTCAVNGAMVCFMGAHAHRIGLLHTALGHAEPAHHWLSRALQMHQRLGAGAWQAETQNALASLGDPDAVADVSDDIAQLRRIGEMWQASYREHTAYLRDTKGLHDLADLLANPGADLSALTLAGGEISHRAHTGRTDAAVDRTALLAYRRRLAELEDELTTAQAHSDLGRRQRATDEREQILAELRRATRPAAALACQRRR